MTDINELRAFCSELALVHEHAIRIGLYKTGHVLHNAVQIVGHEAADLIHGIERQTEEAQK